MSTKEELWDRMKAASHEERLSLLAEEFGPRLVRYITRKFPNLPCEAEDIVQSCLVRLAGDEQLVAQVVEKRGCNLFLVTRRLAIDAIRQGEVREAQPLAGTEAETLASEMSAVSSEDQRRAADLLATAVRRMHHECQKDGRLDLWRLLEARWLVCFFEASPVEFEDLARQLQYDSVKQARNAYATAQKRFRRFWSETLEEAGLHAADGSEEMLGALCSAGSLMRDLLVQRLYGELPGVSVSHISTVGRFLPDVLIEGLRIGDQQPDLAAEMVRLLEAPPFELGDVSEKVQLRLRHFATQKGVLPPHFAGLLQMSEPNLELLQIAKEFAKHNTRSRDKAIPDATATALYNACIVVALLRHSARINTQNDAQLRHAFAWGQRQEWLPDWLRQLFREGIAKLQVEGA